VVLERPAPLLVTFAGIMKEKPPETVPRAFATCLGAGPIIDPSYALVRAESMPLASEPMLLPNTR
jgi:hypothetical protein